MAIVNLYLQMHQPYRLRHYGAFENHDHYFDHDLNEEITRRVVLRSYRPVTRLLLDATLRHAGAFRFSLSITGTLVEQLNAIAPDVLDTLRRLAETGCVEFLAETYHHNLSGLQSPEFFAQELSRHSAMIDKNFGQTPVVVRNTELLYNDQVAQHIDTSGRYRGVLTEGADTILAGRPAGRVYVSPCGLPVLLKHHVFSDDIAFRFGNPNTRPTAAGYAARVTRSAALPLAQENDPTDQEHPAILRNLFMDFETFGEHHAAETGIFDFLAELPGEILQLQHRFLTPREILDEFDPVDFFACPQTISWADEARDASAWLGNDLQKSAAAAINGLHEAIAASNDIALQTDWFRLTTSDHLYYLCTKGNDDGAVHQYFSPYESPYDAYVNLMNVLNALRKRVGHDSQAILQDA